MRILKIGSKLGVSPEIERKCDNCGTEFAYHLNDVYHEGPGGTFLVCPYCRDKIYKTKDEPDNLWWPEMNYTIIE